MRNSRSDRGLIDDATLRLRIITLVLAFASALIPARPVQAKHVAGATTQPARPLNRDWKQFPAIVQTSGVADLYAVGDAHGDYERLADLLVAARIIADPPPAQPDAAKWSAGRSTLVCTGDMIDKYTHSIQVIQLMRSLQAQAREAGGRVIVTLGNHEAEFLAAGGENKKSAEFETELTSSGINPVDVAAGRDSAGIGAWLRNLPAGAKVGDWFFCHGGNTAGEMVSDLEAEIQHDVAEQGFAASVLISDNSMLEARMHPRPWWDADSEIKLKDVKPEKEHGSGKKATEKQAESGVNRREAETASDKRLRKVVEALGAKHLVFGHQPGKITFADGTVREAGQMFSKFDGLLFMIDTGMSRGVGEGQGAVLFIHTNGSTTTTDALLADRKSTRLWP